MPRYGRIWPCVKDFWCCHMVVTEPPWAVAFPSHGRGRRFNPYSAHHYIRGFSAPAGTNPSQSASLGTNKRGADMESVHGVSTPGWAHERRVVRAHAVGHHRPRPARHLNEAILPRPRMANAPRGIPHKPSTKT